MTKEALEARKADLLKGIESIKQQIGQLQNNLVATDGAIQEVDFWLAEFEKENDEH